MQCAEGVLQQFSRILHNSTRDQALNSLLVLKSGSEIPQNDGVALDDNNESIGFL